MPVRMPSELSVFIGSSENLVGDSKSYHLGFDPHGCHVYAIRNGAILKSHSKKHAYGTFPKQYRTRKHANTQ